MKKSLIIILISIALLITQVGMKVSAKTETMPKKSIPMKTQGNIQNYRDRLAGNDRYETAIVIAKEYFSTYDEPSHTVVLVSGEDYPDALSAGPLASACGAPILLTQPNILTSSTKQALKDLKINKVIIVGGTGAVSTKVENAIKAQSISIERIAGIDRYDTSVKVAYKLEEVRGFPAQYIAVASGMGFADALSIAPAAIAGNMPILLTRDNMLPQEVQNYIKKNGEIYESYVVGGNGVISDNVKNKLPKPVRLGGADRFETNLKVIEHFAGLMVYDTVYLASGLNYADALTGTVLAGNYFNTMVLVDNAVPVNTNNYIGKQLTGLSKVVALGGTAVVPDSAIMQVKNNICQDGIDTANDFLSIKIGYADGDSMESVTRNIKLPTSGQNGSVISWISDQPEIISDSGVVMRPEGVDREVGFDVFVNKGNSYYYERFIFVVKKK